MADHTINEELLNYISMLTPIQKTSIVGMIKSFVKPDTKTRRITIKQYNQEISEAEKRIAKGKYITQENLEKDAEVW